MKHQFVVKYAAVLLASLMLLFSSEIQAEGCSDAVAVVKSYYRSLAKHQVNNALNQWETVTKKLRNQLAAARIVKLNRVKLKRCDDRTEGDVIHATVFVDVTAMTKSGRGKWRGTFSLRGFDGGWKIVSRRLKRY